MRLFVPLLVLVPFTAFSFFVVAEHGLSGLVPILREGWGQQLFVDLVIALLVALSWMVPEARTKGINPWPYVAGTVVLGSIGVLGYLVHRGVVERRAA